MSEEMNSLFNENSTEATASSRSLAGTARLTNLATEITNSIMKQIDCDFATYKDQIAQSKVDHSAMDKLITTAYNLDLVDVEFIKQLDEETIDSMLKSQQSKRSRAKGKTMTLDNYRSMMVGAVAENLLRIASGKDKMALSARRVAGSVDYSEEQLEALAADQEKLGKEIRNVQSKKSIMKSKADFNEADSRWLALLDAEIKLKSLRTSTATTTVVKVDETKNKLEAMLGEFGDSEPKSREGKELLARIKELLG